MSLTWFRWFCSVFAWTLWLASCATRSPAPARVAQPAQETPTPHAQDESHVRPAAPPAMFERLVEQVSGTTGAALRPAKVALPQPLQGVVYDAYRGIRFRPERSLWRGDPSRFEVQFFHPGWAYNELVDVFVVEGEQVHPFPFSTHLFSYDSVEAPRSGAGLGFTGLRVHGPINRADYLDEIIVFQGASYFRSLARGQVYGLSARALAVDMGGDGPEEFPCFSDFYLVRPERRAEGLWILATVGSDRARGAYAFYVTPGTTTTVDVFARIWVDAPVDALGLSPMSSMYLFGEEAPASLDDYRPEVHDSDGMAFHSQDGERLFRRLRNPPRTTRSEFRLDSPRGFGLLQRDRDFENYQDLEARYQDRPSAWVEPVGDWGPGALHLLEIPSEQEINDNIALAWVPDHVPPEGLSVGYRIYFGAGKPRPAPGARVTATRIGKTDRGTRFVLDFSGQELQPREQVTADIHASGGRVLEQHTHAGHSPNAVRVSFEVVPDDGARDVELRAFVRRGDDVLSETWSYLWQPNP